MRRELPEDLFLGRDPNEHHPKDLFLANYAVGVAAAAAYVVPKIIDWTKGILAWLLLGNDKLGDCTVAGFMHLLMAMQASLGRVLTFTEAQAILMYEQATGYNPADPSTDQGSTLLNILKWAKKHPVGGFKTEAYAVVNAQNLTEFYTGMDQFQGIYCGVYLPTSAMDQFRAGKPWTVVKRSHIEGGHCITGVKKVAVGQTGMVGYVTWGALQLATEAWHREYCDEARVVVSDAQLGPNGRNVLGYDVASLIADAKKLAA